MSRTAVADRPRVAVDPRIAQRRRQVSADNRRRWLRRSAVVAAVVVVAAGLVALTRTSLLDVDEIQVHGTVRTTEDAVVAASGLTVGQPILELDEGAAAAGVAALPWVADVEVDRAWRSGEVVITVTERSAAAVVATPTTWSLLDATGRVLATVDRPPAPPAPPAGEAPDEATQAAMAAHEDPAAVLPEAAGLPVVVGPEPGPPGTVLAEGAGPLLDVAAHITPGVATRVAAVRAEGPEVVLDLRPQGLVALGPPEELDVKLRTVTTVLAEADLTCLAVIDVRVADTAVLTREPGCE